jgi:2,4-dienoyl-CoA reductase-like NADH-dependent reductase (Old Yellow Enzyme family)/thioredoxin reductase
MEYKMLFSPMNIGKVTIRNRIVMSPMLMGFGRLDGHATEQMMDYYEERARGGTGLIITEITRINDNHGAGAFAQLAASKDHQIAGLAEMARRIHLHGAKLFVQLHHPGRQNIGLLVHTVPLLNACQKVYKGTEKLLYKIVPAGKILLRHNIVPCSVCPSKVEPSYFTGGRVRALRKREIKMLVRQFISGAVRVQKAGCDGVELHATHGYLIQQFLSPHTNRRTDEYGGNFENRMRFLTEIIRGIRSACGKDFPIIVRLTVDECYDRIGRKGTGYGLDEGIRIARHLEALGIDAIDVSSASYDAFNYWLEPTSFACGWRTYMAEAVKKAVKIPVIAANLIRSPEQAEKQLQDGIQDFVSLGRPHIADPHWANKVKEGQEKSIKRCICCLYCIESMQENAYKGSHGHCSVNPAVGKERASNAIQRDGEGRLVLIAGAGVAGLTAAETLLKRGFRVKIYEKEAQAGGQILLADKPPHKEKLFWCIEDLVYAVNAAGGEIIYNTPATADMLAKQNPYAVIVATGASALRPGSIEGCENAFTSTDILSGAVVLREKKVAVIGSGMTGLETAELLAEYNNQITVIEMAKTLAPGTWFQHKDDIIPKLKEKGCVFLTGTKLLKICGAGILLEDLATGEHKELPFDHVVLSLGSGPVNHLFNELKGKVNNLYLIGDAQKIGRIADATAEAYQTAITL